tara:strand:- start:649 stop:990 length:342 start_codon:yes stop_codon:yes gene_type:complete
MFPGMNPRKMQQMMKRMGIQQVEVPANEVIIKQGDKEIVISNPQVSKVNMMGQETFQVVGSISERAVSSAPEIKEEDVKTVMEQTGAAEDKVKETLEETKGDLAEAIIKLKEE